VEPRIQYAKTKDGVSIAYYTLGEGAPLVCTILGQWSHMQFEWGHPEFRRWYERLAEKRMVVRYDSRGSGLSDRDVTDYSLEAHLLDLEAVVDQLGLKKFSLFTLGAIGPAVITYAARHPERVSRLVLFATWARQPDYTSSPQIRGMFGLLDTDWQMFTENAAHTLLGWSEGKQAHWFAALLRETTTTEAMRAATAAGSEFDVTSLLPEVRSPTLVLHPRDLVALDIAISRGLASRIPDARLVVVEGTSMAPQVGDIEPLLRAIDDFLSEGEETAPELPEGVAVLLFADIAESTALTEQLGDAAFRAKARELDTSLRPVIKESGGTPVEGKVLGDGVLAVFTSARQAIDCALRCDAASQPLGLKLHLGIHAGDVIREGNNVYGGAVNIAARVASASAPGEILVSDIVRGLARTSAGVIFDDRGEHELKGVGEPQRLFAVRGGG
jgi:class 3 adenylate cyclase